MILHIVGRGYVLHDPQGKGRQKAWLLEGQTLDVSDPWVVQEIRGQEYKLEIAPAGATETPKTAWPGPLVGRWMASLRVEKQSVEVLEAITPEPPADEEPSLEPKRRGRRKKADNEL
jgi:hypothetical protein